MFLKHSLQIAASALCGGLIGAAVLLAMVYGAAIALGPGPPPNQATVDAAEKYGSDNVTFREAASFSAWGIVAGSFGSVASTLLTRWRPAATWPIVAIPVSLLVLAFLLVAISAISAVNRLGLMPWDDLKAGPFLACGGLVFLMVPAFLGGVCGQKLGRMF